MSVASDDEVVRVKDIRISLNREKTIRRFYGDEDDVGEAVEEWQEEIRRAWTTQGLEKDEKLGLLKSCIGPLVKAELRAASQDDREDPEKALNLIVREFGEERSPTELLQHLLSLFQEPEEKIRTYANRLQAAFDALNRREVALGDRPTEEKVLVQHFLSSVRDPVLASTLRERLHQNKGLKFRDLREVAIR